MIMIELSQRSLVHYNNVKIHEHKTHVQKLSATSFMIRVSDTQTDFDTTVKTWHIEASVFLDFFDHIS